MLSAYEGERAYDTETLSVLTGVFATIIGVLSVVGSTLAFVSLHRRGLPGLLTAFLPVVPLPFIGWGAICANTMIARGEVIRMYEDALRRAANLRLQESAGVGLPVPFGDALVSRVWWSRRYVMLLSFGVIGLLYVGILGLSAYYAYQLSAWFVLFVSFPCLLALVVLLRAYLAAFLPEVFIRDAALKVFDLDHESVPLAPSARHGTVVARWIGSGLRAFVPVTALVFLLAGLAFYSQVYRRPGLRGGSSSTQALFFAAQLGKAMNQSVARVVPMRGSLWLVRFKDGSCYTVDTHRFDLIGPRGFASVACSAAR